MVYPQRACPDLARYHICERLMAFYRLAQQPQPNWATSLAEAHPACCDLPGSDRRGAVAIVLSALPH